MREYLGEAIVLDRLPNGDMNGRVVFLTKRFGKLVGKAKSVRKITSKLSGHLQPGNLIQLRMVEKNGLQIVDALKKSRLPFSLKDLRFLGEILSEAEPEFRIWDMLAGDGASPDKYGFSWGSVLKILGWDPNFASCGACYGAADAFHSRTQEFFCENCALKLPPNDVIYVGSREAASV